MKDNKDKSKPKSKPKKEKQYNCNACKDTGYTGGWLNKKPCSCGQSEPLIIP